MQRSGIQNIDEDGQSDVSLDDDDTDEDGQAVVSKEDEDEDEEASKEDQQAIGHDTPCIGR